MRPVLAKRNDVTDEVLWRRIYQLIEEVTKLKKQRSKLLIHCAKLAKDKHEEIT